MMIIVITKHTENSSVIVRLDRTIQYAAAFAFKPRRLRLPDTRFRGYDHDHWPTDV
jgi:hypothetical protein